MTDRERPLRLVVFSPSIIADIDNPAATSTRALLGVLSAAGHEVTHLERRGNPLLDRQLKVRGSAALRSLNARHPRIRVRQYDLPHGQQRNVWFGTEVSTADAVVALPGTPEEILALVASFETPYLVRVVSPGSVGDLEVWDAGELACAEPRTPIDVTILGIAVAYDNIEQRMTADVPANFDRVVVGDSDLPGWRYLPEVEVAELYRSTRSVMVLDGDERPEALVRVLLPLAAGCEIVTTWGADGQTRTLSSELSSRNDAAMVAELLASMIRETLARKRREFAARLPGR